jgi:hypothetical protein
LLLASIAFRQDRDRRIKIDLTRLALLVLLRHLLNQVDDFSGATSIA